VAQAEFKEVIGVDKDKLFKTITSYESYPQFVQGCKKVQVDRKNEGLARVSYEVSMMKDVTYTLDHQEYAQSGKVEWSLVESDTFKKNNGLWELKTVGPGKTEVYYRLDVEFKIPVPGFIVNKLVKGSLPDMVKSFVKKANS
jgi:ribosome-associated toxin RatA of RatAB toxin-antitoxin module